ncbi:MAG: UvrD-helicase domain-containing protein, partial [Candidatus Marinimicrobia bacterium]|nr:UvrD-helicase domain-containing protein [Candidatus Neomarinimicrobiota bacterium]
MLKLITMADFHNERDHFIKNITENQFVCAAAGTGKTTVLVKRYLEILLSETADCDQIIAITFTDKAANEMKERLRTELSRNRAGFDTAKIASLIEHLNIAPISTVHSFCARILRDNVAELPFDPLFKICDETAEAILRERFMRKFLDGKITERDPDLIVLIQSTPLAEIEKLLNLIYEKQAECIAILERYRNITATDFLTEIEKVCRDYNYALLHDYFNDPAVHEIVKQIKSLNTNKTDDALHSNFDIILNASAEVFDRQRIPDSLWNGSLRKALSGGKRGAAAVWGSDLELVRGIHSQLVEKFKIIKDSFISFDAETEKIHTIYLQSLTRLALNFLQEYRTEMRQKALLDFTGIETETESLLARRSSAIVRYVRHFKRLLVDEFQDINPIQYHIIKLLQEINPDLVTFFVGDEKQSIYRFRGAEVEIFNTLREQSVVQTLSTNYRSGQTLMDFYNFFFAQLLGTELPAERYDVHYPQPIDAFDNFISTEPPVELILINEDEAFADRQPAEKPTDESLEAKAVAASIQKLHKTEIVREKGKMRPAEFGDMTILLRSRTHQSKFEEALRQTGIPFYVVTGIGFYDQPEVVDLTNYLR